MISRDRIREILVLKRTPRTGWFAVGVDSPESIADHTCSTALLVWQLARETPGTDPHRCVLMALLHDLHEARLGDIPTPAKRHFEGGAILAAERGIIAEQWADDPEALALLGEFLDGETADARLVRAADHLEFLFQAAEYRREGRPLTERMIRRAHAGAAWEHPATRPWVDELLAELETP
jgi:putative hydrolase of HD superfamily